jgi:hypothetical protein
LNPSLHAELDKNLVAKVGQFKITHAESVHVMGGPPKVNPAKNIAPFRMVVELLGHHRHSGHKRKGFIETLELKRSLERTPVICKLPRIRQSEANLIMFQPIQALTSRVSRRI